MVRSTNHVDMTIAVDWDVKPQNKLHYTLCGILSGSSLFAKYLFMGLRSSKG